VTVPAILVLGATGRIGSAVVEQLLPDHAAGRVRLVAAVRRPEAARQLAARGLDVREIDLNVAERRGLAPVVDALRGIDRVLVLTGYDVKMLAQSKAVVDAAQAAGALHLVHIGVLAAPDTTIVHFAWHQLVEAYIERAGLGYTHLHPASFMQMLPMLAQIGGAGRGAITHYVGDARIGWVDTGDIAAVAAAVLRDPYPHAGRRYKLATEAATMAEVAAMIGAVTGRAWRYDRQEPEQFLRAVIAVGADPIYMACVRNVFERMREGSLPELAEVSDTVARITGRAPASLRDYIERNRAAFAAGAAA
jgi:uncharacterized protein YbjT (DUF2867 family)